jgi:ubiquinone/menaquinone biosynthesis C-methylase UbiE
MKMEQACAPNHHAHYPGFAGLTGLLGAASMILGRQGDARLADELSGLRPEDTVVDVGCGPGAAARRAARKAASVTGVDPAPIMLRVARLLSRQSKRVRFVEGTAEALPLSEDSVSILWSIASVHHWADLEAGLGEALRVLRPGGRLVAIERHTRRVPEVAPATDGPTIKPAPLPIGASHGASLMHELASTRTGGGGLSA